MEVFDVGADGAAVPAASPRAPRRAGSAWRWVLSPIADPAFGPWVHAALPEAASALLDAETRPRCEPGEEGLLLNLRAMNAEPDEDMVSIRIWLAGDLMVVTGRRPATTVEAMRDAARAGRAPASPGAFLAALVDGLTVDIERASLVLDDRADDMEETLTAGDAEFEDAEELPVLRRRTIALRRYLAPQREALDRLGRVPVGALGKRPRAALREAANRTTRSLEEIDATRDRLSALADHLTTLQRMQVERHNYILTIVAAIFLPLNLLAGLFGANLAGIPFEDEPWGFGALVGFCALVGLGLWLFFRRRRWF